LDFGFSEEWILFVLMSNGKLLRILKQTESAFYKTND